MPLEEITVIAGGASPGGGYGAETRIWETVVIEIDYAVGYVNCLLTTTEITPIGASTQAAFDKWHYPPGTPIEVYANGDLVMANAFVWQYAPSADANQHSITLHIKSIAYNPVISSIIAPQGGTYENKTVYEIIAEWAQAHGVSVANFSTGKLVPFWMIRLGATGYEEMLRLAKPHGLLVHGMMDGRLAVSDGRAMGVMGPVVQGENIIRMSAQLTDEQFREIHVVGQQNLGTQLNEALQPAGQSAWTAPDGSGSLAGRRKKLIVEPTLIDRERAQWRAMWDTARTQSATTQAVITVPGWHAPAGENYVQENYPAGMLHPGLGPLWLLGADVFVYAPWLKINCVMRISKVVFKQSLAEGSTTELTLVDPGTVQIGSEKPAGKCESGSIWSNGFNFGGNYMPGFMP